MTNRPSTSTGSGASVLFVFSTSSGVFALVPRLAAGARTAVLNAVRGYTPFLQHHTLQQISFRNYDKTMTKQAFCRLHKYCVMRNHNYHITAEYSYQEEENIHMKQMPQTGATKHEWVQAVKSNVWPHPHMPCHIDIVNCIIWQVPHFTVIEITKHSLTRGPTQQITRYIINFNIQGISFLVRISLDMIIWPKCGNPFTVLYLHESELLYCHLFLLSAEKLGSHLTVHRTIGLMD